MIKYELFKNICT